MGSIPDDVTEIVHLHNASGCTMVLGTPQLLTEKGVKTSGA